MIKIDFVKNTNDLETLKKAISYKNVNYRIAVAGNKYVTKEIINQLIDDENIDVVIEIAKSDKLDPKMIKKLCKKDNILINSELAKNPCCPKEILDVFSNNDDLLYDLAANPSLELKTITKILNKNDPTSFNYDVILDLLQKRNDIQINTKISFEITTK